MAAQKRSEAALPGSNRGAMDDVFRSPRNDASKSAPADRCAGSETERLRSAMSLLLSALVAQATPAAPTGWGSAAPIATRSWPTREGDVILRKFRFRPGEFLPEVRMHYTTL